jgi:hypothetical protein
VLHTGADKAVMKLTLSYCILLGTKIRGFEYLGNGPGGKGKYKFLNALKTKLMRDKDILISRCLSGRSSFQYSLSKGAIPHYNRPSSAFFRKCQELKLNLNSIYILFNYVIF